MTLVLIKKMIVTYALAHNVDPYVALSIANIESNYRHDVVSHTEDYGIFQINKKYYPDIEHASIEENIEIGIKHLKFTKKHCSLDKERLHKKFPYNGKHLKNLWIVCYNVGVNGIRKLKEPWKFEYFRKFQEEYRRQRTNEISL